MMHSDNSISMATLSDNIDFQNESGTSGLEDNNSSGMDDFFESLEKQVNRATKINK